MAFEWTTQLPRSKDPTEFRRVVFRQMQITGQEFNAEHIRENLSGRRGGDMGLNRRSGNLARGWLTAATNTADGAEVRNWTAGPAAEYSALQEFGGTIRPVRAKHLWIPTKQNQTTTGVARMSPRDAIQRGGFVSWKRGGVFFGKPAVKTARKHTTHGLVPLFVLKKSVYVPPRQGATSLFMRKMQQLATAIAFLSAEYA